MMVSTVRGEFTKVSGTVQIDARDLSRSSVHVVIDAASINTRDPQRDAHLRSADFLDVDNHPTIEFDSTRIIRDSGSLKLVGDLTIRGVTREVTLDVEDAGVELKDPWGGVRRGASAKTRVNRKDFGLQWNVALEAGGFVVGDDVRIEIDVELVKKD
jgi:polyisoprenoid-binding protein YceI